VTDSRQIPIALIVCMARNRVIGRDRRMPWRMPSDMKHFKALTMGKPVVMGRATFDSIGRALPGRPSFVVSRQQGLDRPGAVVLPDLGSAILAARSVAESSGASEIMVLGGGEIYRQALALAERIYMTVLDVELAGDTQFPELSDQQWKVQSRTPLETGPADDYQAETIVMVRAKP
jgi:dihydrofolate reductase